MNNIKLFIKKVSINFIPQFVQEGLKSNNSLGFEVAYTEIYRIRYVEPILYSNKDFMRLKYRVCS